MKLLELSNINNLKVKEGFYNGISGKAVFSKNNNIRKRYFLEKRWGQGTNVLTALMMNPSKAAHDNSDDTVNQLIEVAKNNNCDALYVVNVSSYIEGSSKKMKSDKFIFDNINWSYIEHAISESKIIFIGWGMKGQNGILQQIKKNRNVIRTLNEAKELIYAYEFVQSKNKKYINKPFYYVPHPRPIWNKEKYRKQSLHKLTLVQFDRLFNR
ncbi:DUF1643 domain-containing protein [Paenibacillus tundrae]|uniref:DUF1643 domain-containing protein n=1 Tax=Paenibacillus tundrae TaxID=528187 RepID=UPI0030D0B6EF